MATRIHPSAQVDPKAELADGVRVGPLAVIGAGVELGPDCEVGAQAQIQGPARFGRQNRIFGQACLGFDPQDLKYAGEETRLEVGHGNMFREFCTVHRGTQQGGGVTTIGDDNLFMTGSHVAHDCRIGSQTVFANNGTLAGHVEVQDWARVGAFTSVHQFCRVGAHAYLGAYSVITMDALPFATTVGMKPQCYGVNRVGLSRRGFDDARIRPIEKAIRLLTRSGMNTTQAVEDLAELAQESEDVRVLIGFVDASERGIIKAGRRGSRGGDG